MKRSSLIRSGLLLSGSLALMFSFQNCGQPGAIVQKGSFTSTSEIQSDPQPEIPVDSSPQYRSLEKNVKVENQSPKVDVLVVIDNSKSMAYEQTSMASRFGSFLDKLQGLDWQVGIVTTQIGSSTQNNTNLMAGNLVQYKSLNKYVVSSSDKAGAAQDAFATTIKRSEYGSGEEQGIHATYLALEKSLVSGSRNSVLVRPGAALSVIVITDADETPVSDADGDESKFPSHGKNFAKNLIQMVTQKFPGKGFKFHSIIVKPNDLNCLKDATEVNKDGKMITNENESYGKQYVKASNSTGGVVGSVCESDYSDQLRSMGESTANQVKNVTLDCNPVDADKNGHTDVEVRNVGTGALLADYKVVGLQIEFDQVLAPADYKIVYRCLQE